MSVAETNNAAVVSELHALAAQRIITVDQLQRLAERYPTGRWDVLMLVRAFTLLGALAVAAGVVIIAPRVIDVKVLIDGSLLLGTVGLLAGANLLKTKKDLPRAAAVLELCAGFTLQGLTVALAKQFSTGSDNWPALIGGDTALLLGLAYGVKNRLVLIHALVCAFVFFGGETGYISGWGAYWLGMNYPLRFLVAGLVCCSVAYAHYRYFTGALQSFSRVYAHWGLLVGNFALWFFSLFGYFEKDIRWSGNESERLVFSLLWAAVSMASIFGGIRLQLDALRSYGLVFLIIDVYTFYFQFVVPSTIELWFFHLLLVGGSLLAVGFWIERKRAARRGVVPPVAG